MTDDTPNIVLGYFTGQESAEQAAKKIADLAQAAVDTTAPGYDPVLRRKVATDEHTRNWLIARYHVDLTAQANDLAHVLALSDRCRDDANQQWASLVNTLNWHATHHRFVLAADEAREHLNRAIHIARNMLRHEVVRSVSSTDRPGNGFPPITLNAYTAAMGDRAVALPELPELEHNLTELVEEFCERFTLARATTIGALPPGFETRSGYRPA